MNITETLLPAFHVLGSDRPLVIAHRGFCHLAPENTLPCFKLALQAGADLVELDYRHSKDGVPVVVHDPELTRTTNARRKFKRRHVKVASRTAAEIQALDAGRWFNPRYAGTGIPLLSEALDVIQFGSIALIEHKAGDPETLLQLLRAKGLINKVIVQSFDWAFLRRLHELEPAQVLGALGPAKRLPNGKRPLGIVRKLNRAWLEQAGKTGARVVVWSQKVSKGIVRQARARGFKVWVYTVNYEKLALRLLRAGVSGIITNNPPLIRHLVQAGPAKVGGTISASFHTKPD